MLPASGDTPEAGSIACASRELRRSCFFEDIGAGTFGRHGILALVEVAMGTLGGVRGEEVLWLGCKGKSLAAISLLNN